MKFFLLPALLLSLPVSAAGLPEFSEKARLVSNEVLICVHQRGTVAGCEAEAKKVSAKNGLKVVLIDAKNKSPNVSDQEMFDAISKTLRIVKNIGPVNDKLSEQLVEIADEGKKQKWIYSGITKEDQLVGLIRIAE